MGRFEFLNAARLRAARCGVVVVVVVIVVIAGAGAAAGQGLSIRSLPYFAPCLIQATAMPHMFMLFCDCRKNACMLACWLRTGDVQTHLVRDGTRASFGTRWLLSIAGTVKEIRTRVRQVRIGVAYSSKKGANTAQPSTRDFILRFLPLPALSASVHRYARISQSTPHANPTPRLNTVGMQQECEGTVFCPNMVQGQRSDENRIESVQPARQAKRMGINQ